MPLPGQARSRSTDAAASSLRERWAKRPRRVQTVLAPALPALVMLGFITAGMIDPPQSGLTSQLHITKTSTATTWTVTPR